MVTIGQLDQLLPANGIRMPTAPLSLILQLVVSYLDAVSVFTLCGAEPSLRILRQCAYELAHGDRNAQFESVGSSCGERTGMQRPLAFNRVWTSLTLPLLQCSRHNLRTDKTSMSPPQPPHPFATVNRMHPRLVALLHQLALPVEYASLEAAFLALHARFRFDPPLVFNSLPSFESHCGTLQWRRNVSLVLTVEPLFDPSRRERFLNAMTAHSEFSKPGRKCLNLARLSLDGCLLGDDGFQTLVGMLHPSLESKVSDSDASCALRDSRQLSEPTLTELQFLEIQPNLLRVTRSNRGRGSRIRPNAQWVQQRMQLRNNASRVNHTTRSNTCPNCCMPIYAPQATKSLEDDVQTPQKECEGFESTYFSRQRPLPTKCPVCKNPIAYPQLNENQSAVLLGRLSGISKPSMNSKVLNLQALNLNENLLTDESLECISTRILPVSRGLLKLDLKGNQFTADGVKVLAHHLPPTNITHLNLSGIKLTDSGLQPLARCLNLTSLRSLILADNLITQSGIGSLAPYLPDTRIAVLDLGCNQGIRDQGLAGLSAVLSRTCISELILAECDFGFQGLQALTKVLRKSRISHLKISRNRRIGDNGIKYLSEYGLKNCEQLTQLHIRAVNALDAGCCALASVLASPRCSLRVLDMRDNGITNKGAFALNGVGFGLLETVKLGENDITDRGVEALASAFVRSRVVELSLEDNKFSDVGVDALVMAFEQARRGRMVKITW